jgi:hypothetical protein
MLPFRVNLHWLLAFVLSATFAVRLQAQRENTIVVWKVGSPHRGDTPAATVAPELARQAASRGVRIEVEAFPSLGFTPRFLDAWKRGAPPDVLVLDNMGIINGITTEREGIVGLGQYPNVRAQLTQVTGSFDALLGPQRGWTYLFAASRAHALARDLALRTPACPDESAARAIDSGLSAAAREAAAAYLQKDPGRLAAHSDPSRLSGPPRDRETVRVASVRPCNAWGNDTLGFVQANASYEGASALGHQQLVLVFRRLSQWRLLAASRDPVTNTTFVQQMPRISAVLDRGEPPGAPAPPAVLRAPANGAFPQPVHGQRFGDFVWQSSPSEEVVAEIAEFSYTDDARLFLQAPVGRLPLTGTLGRVSAGQLWSTRGEWMWRIWSISRSGDVTFSEVRTFQH